MTKHYNQPSVEVTPIVSMALMQAASPAVSSGKDKINNIETNDQW